VNDRTNNENESTNMAVRSFPSNIEDITFGVEIETTIPAGIVRVGPYHNGTPVANGPAFNGAFWKAELDGSILARIPGHTPCEFVSPILKGEAGVAHLIQFVEWLNAIGARVNVTCGLHIHVGLSGFTGTTAADVLAEYLAKLAHVTSFNATALYAQTGTLSREGGHYCARPGQAYRASVRRIRKAKSVSVNLDVNRYQLLNLTNVSRNQTVEFRCFAGTLNADKILAHLFSVILICRVAAQLKTLPSWTNKPWSGSDAVRNLLKVRPVLRLVSCQPFGERFRAMVSKAFEMAQKYDLARAGTPTPVE
jgi:hypothetical protein